MAPVFDQNLGSRQTNAGGTTITLTTAASAAAYARMFVCVGCQINVGSPVDVLSVTGGGLVFNRTSARTINGNNMLVMFDLNAPAAGLASSTVLTATFSQAPNTIGDILACSFTGLDGPVENTVPQGTGLVNGNVAWQTTIQADNTDDVILAFSLIDSTTVTANAPGTGTEIHDIWLTGRNRGVCSEYTIISTPGTQTLSGTWSGNTGSTSNLTLAATVRAYKDSLLPGRMPLGV